MLKEEAEADKQLRGQFGARWTRTPSENLTQMFVSKASKYKQIIENAVQADSVVRQKYETHREVSFLNIYLFNMILKFPIYIVI